MDNNPARTTYRLFVTGYLLFYILMQLSFSMQIRTASEGAANWLFTGIMGFANAFLPYYSLQKYHPSSLLKKVLWLSISVIIPVLLHLLVAQLILSLSFNKFFDTSYQLLVTLSFYGIGFYFIRHSHQKKMQAKEAEIKEKENRVAMYQQLLLKNHVFHQLERIEMLVQTDPPAALDQISGFCDELQQILYSINKPSHE